MTKIKVENLRKIITLLEEFCADSRDLDEILFGFHSD
jgi:hypothetical protein